MSWMEKSWMPHARIIRVLCRGYNKRVGSCQVGGAALDANILPFAPFSNNYFAKLEQPARGEAAQLLQAEDTYMAAIVTSLVRAW